jgi:hypothetical protein
VLPKPLHERRIAGTIAFLKIPWKISWTNSVRWSGSGGSKGGSSVEDQDRETRTDEEVEGHMHKNAPAASHKAANDEGDDVEGHMHKNAANLGMHKNRNLGKDDDDVEGHMHKNRNVGKDDDDDVEAHVHLNAVNKGVHKA